MSVPWTTSGRSGEESSSDGNRTAGRRLAKQPKAWRSLSSPFSGGDRWESDQTPAADRAEQHRFGGLAGLERVVGTDDCCGEPCAAYRLNRDLNFVVKNFGNGVENTQSFGNDFRPDAIAGQRGDFQEQRFPHWAERIRSVEISDSHFLRKSCCVSRKSESERSFAPLDAQGAVPTWASGTQHTFPQKWLSEISTERIPLSPMRNLCS